MGTSFDIVSDIHLDFFPRFGTNINNKRKFISTWKYWKPGAKNLLIAGDIGHIDEQNVRCLKWLREEIYDNICFVFGNHDLYLCNSDLQDSYERIKQVAAEISEVDGIHLLDGNIVTIDGVAVGGAMGWYDGSYLKTLGIANKDNYREVANILWRQVLNDSRQTTLTYFDEPFEGEYKKLLGIVKDVQVMLTHINPSNLREHQSQQYASDDTTCFYNFDGSELLHLTTASHWLFGHTHDPLEYTREGTRVLSNPRGYAFENADFRLKQINI